MEVLGGLMRQKDSCFLRHEFAQLLILNIEQLTRLQIELAQLVVVSGEDKALGCILDGIVKPSLGSAIFAQVPTDNKALGKEAPSPLLEPISIGNFVLEDDLDRRMIIKQLLVTRIQQFKSFVKAFHEELRIAGLHVCLIRLDTIMDTLSKICCLIKVE
jgi:hypothetical protein